MPSESRTAGADGSDARPRKCLSFAVSGPWGHFRRIEGNIVKQTYRIIPRTTVAGLIAAMLGIGRDQYYELFAENESAIAVEPISELRTMNMPVNTLSTADEHMVRVPKRGRKLKIGLPDPTKPRQQHNYEVLVDPAYRIDCWLSDDETYSDLRDLLSAGESHYVPSLGLSEHLASIDFLGEFAVSSGPDEGEVEVDSTVPEAIDSIVPREGMNYGIERPPSFMTAEGGGRTTTGFTPHAFSTVGDSLLARNVTTDRVDDRTVMFV